MSRVIKFRVWDSVNKRFARLQHFVSTDGLMYSDVDPNGCDMSGKIKIRVASRQYEFAGMCTGILDKNGKEIYESDIVKLDNGDDETMTEVRFVDGAFIVEWDNGFLGGDADLQAVGWAMHECSVEVIGNIYEHKHLLK